MIESPIQLIHSVDYHTTDSDWHSSLDSKVFPLYLILQIYNIRLSYI